MGCEHDADGVDDDDYENRIKREFGCIFATYNGEIVGGQLFVHDPKSIRPRIAGITEFFNHCVQPEWDQQDGEQYDADTLDEVRPVSGGDSAEHAVQGHDYSHQRHQHVLCLRTEKFRA